MKNYPWLIKLYNNIINYYQSKYKQNTILISSTTNVGENILSYSLSKWILCKNKNKINSCNKCSNCKLMLNKNNPYYHKIKISNDTKKYNKEKIILIFNMISHIIKSNCKQVIYIKNIENLNKHINNYFINLLTKPQNNTYLILNTNNLITLKKKINNRFIIWKIPNPNEEICTNWIQKKTKIKKKKCIIAFNLAQRSPLHAINYILKKKYWKNRKKLEIILLNILNKKYKLDLLTNIDLFNDVEIIKWICIMLMDTIKWKYKTYNIIINDDQKILIKNISKKLSILSIYKSIKNWTKYINLLNLDIINKKSILIKYLLHWENSLSKTK